MLLLKDAASIEKSLGKSAPHRMVLGLNKIEKSRQYDFGACTLIVGYINDLARYLVVRKKAGPLTPFAFGEFEGILNLVAPSSLWKETVVGKEPEAIRPNNPRRRTSKPDRPTRFFKYVEKEPKSGDIKFEILAWLPGRDPWAFCYLPGGEPPLFVTEYQVQSALE
jgi:hypothetical protein